jgi:hypothetical protein
VSRAKKVLTVTATRVSTARTSSDHRGGRLDEQSAFLRTDRVVELPEERQSEQAVDPEALGEVEDVDAKLRKGVPKRRKPCDPQRVAVLVSERGADRRDCFAVACALPKVIDGGWPG